ncbi:hypothetical protein AB0H83_26285 [Dactylosporangium sp. NPDC050688]|uniref:hypothetical protein n=1 Tax=Dactylosporangium sp. NPDC050688 TaxID=3157217 RepID=UPI0033C0D01C
MLANRGSINYCVRWDSSAPVSAALRDQIHAALARQFKKWMDVMAGHMVGAVNADNIHILLHEIGHSFGLDDFYDWTPSGVGGFIMKAGSAAQITEFDAWMLRDWWRHLKNRYGY